MAKHLNVNLAFTADTGAARAQIKDLQSQISSLLGSVNQNDSLGITKEVKEASKAVATLQSQLKNAINTDTGKLNLTEFNKSLQKSGYTLKDYKTALMNLGPAGAQAFSTLASSITKAEMPLRRSNTLLSEMWTTMKNTARWQLTSSVLHGFIGGLQRAIGYAEDLNKTLTDIRIVAPEKSMEDMYKFAALANKQAKELSSTTLDYAKGALIYYQQGLDDALTKERTDVTTKMANVTGDNVEEVSSYMTSIWNNFNKAGDESAEHFADILTKLGAETAASTTEITTALEKYTGVANTIGLSYESATAAATTLIDRMRETPEVAGTALKTIFARMEGLKLEGSTDEGGTTTDLNKYSKALHQIGVEIKDANGEIREADDILMDLGEKWNSGELSQDVKIATAETVAGIRQWQQFAALMDNFDYFKQYKEMAAFGSDGALQEQQDIYAESWEAASNRVQAAIEEIYSQVLDDKFFIKLTNGAADLVNIISDIIDSLGGLKGVLLLIGTITTSVFKDQFASGLQSLVLGIKSFTKSGRESVANLKQEVNQELQGMLAADKTATSQLMGEAYASQGSVANDLIEQSKTLTKSQQEIASILVDQHNTLVQNAIEQGKIAQEAEKEANAVKRSTDTYKNVPAGSEQKTKGLLKSYGQNQSAVALSKEFQTITMDQKKIGQEADAIKNRLNAVFENLKKTGQSAEDVFGNRGAKALRIFKHELEQANGNAEAIEKALSRLNSTVVDVSDKIAGELSNLNVEDEVLETVNKSSEALAKQQLATADASENAKTFGQRLKEIPSGANATISSMAALGTSLMAVGMAASSLIGIGNTIQQMVNGEIGTVEGLVSILMSLSMVLIALKQVQEAELLLSAKNAAMTILATTVKGAKTAATGAETIATKLLTIALGEATAAEYAFLGPLLLIVAAAAVVVGAIYGIYKAFNSASDKAREAKDELNAANQAAKEASEAYTNLSQSLDSIKDAQTTLATLTKGTQEWKQAVIELNNQILQLLDKYPELAQFISNKDGVLSISEEGTNYLLDAQQKKVSAAQNDVFLKTQASIQAENNQLLQEVLSQTSIKGFEDETAIGAILQDYLENNNSIFTNDASKYFSGAEVGQSLKEYLGDDYNTIIKYCDEIAANTAELKATASNTAAEWMKANGYEDNYANDRFKSVIDEEFENANWEDYKDNYYSRTGVKSLTEEDLKRYVEEVMGEDYDKIGASQRLFDQGLKYTDEQGETQKIDADTIIEALAQRDAQNAAMQTGMAYSNALGAMGQGFASGFTGVDSGDALEASNAFVDLLRGNADSYVKLNEEQLKLVDQIINTNLTFEKLQEVTGLSADELEKLGITAENVSGVSGFASSSMARENAQALASSSIQGLSTDQLNSVYEQWQSGDSEGAAENARQMAGLPEEGWWSEEGKNAGLKWKEAFQAAMEEIQGNTDDYEAMAKQYGLDSKELEDYTNNLMENADTIDYLDDNLIKHEDIAQDVARAQLRCNRAVEKITSSSENWAKALKKSNRGSAEWSKAINEIKDSMGDLLDIDASSLSDDFANNADNLRLMEEAANGSEEALDELRFRAQQDIIQQCGVHLNEDEMAALYEEMNGLDDYLHSADFEDLEIGAKIDNQEFLDSCEEIINAADMTQQQAEDYLTAMGIDADIVEEPIPGDETTTETENITVGTETAHFSVPTLDLAGMVDGIGGVPAVKNSTYDFTYPVAKKGGSTKTTTTRDEGTATALHIQGATKSGGGNISAVRGSKSGSRGGGRRTRRRGSGSSSARKARASTQYEKSNTINRYKEITDTLDRNGRVTDRLAKLQDRLYGKNRLNKMDEVNKKHLAEIKLLRSKVKEAKNYLGVDKAMVGQRLREAASIAQSAIKKQSARFNNAAGKALTKTINSLGSNFTYNSNGEITNYTTIMKALQDELNLYEAVYNNPKNFNTEESQNEYKDKYITPLSEAIDRLQSAIDQYDETRELIQELKDNINEAYTQWLDLNYEKLTYSLEIKTTVNDNDLQYLEHKISQIQDNIYKTAEILDYYFSGSGDTKLNTLNEAINIQTNNFKTLTQEYQNGKISQEQYVEGLQNSYNALLSNIEAVSDLKKELTDYYSNVLDSTISELDKYISRAEHLNSLTDHYRNILELTGKATNYNLIEQLQAANAATATTLINMNKAEYDTATYEAEKYLKAYNEIKQKIEDRQKEIGNVKNDAVMQNLQDEAEVMRKAYEMALETANNAEEQMFTAVQNALELAAEQLQTALDRAAKAVEKALTGIVGSFEELARQMDMTSTRQEEYLTKTNQSYELNKLQRMLSKDMDKTDSKAAKTRLANFSKELKALEEKDELSNLELEIAQKKYELLKAQIALEDSQNAKSVIRLSRDNEGNYGYVYVANEEETEDAEQAVEDAKNDLYNLQLEATNNYGQKYTQVIQEYQDALYSFMTSEEYKSMTEDERNYRLAKLQEQYGALIGSMEDLYGIAWSSTDYLVGPLQNDSWVYKNYNDNIQLMGNNLGAFNTEIDSANSALNIFNTQIENIVKYVNFEERMNNVVTTTEKTMNSLAKDFEDTGEQMTKILNDVGNKIAKFVEDTIPQMNKWITDADNIAEQIKNIIENAANGKINRSTEKLNEFLVKWGGEDSNYKYTNNHIAYNDTTNTIGLGTNAENWTADTIAKNEVTAGKLLEAFESGQSGYFGFDSNGLLSFITGVSSTSDTAYKNWVKKVKGAKAFDTGGYTGEWTNDGRIAVLHEKELVLNETDTQNILNAVNIVRDKNFLTALNSPSFSWNKDNQQLEQNVKIEAQFPNVTDRYEIEQAFSNLVNRASQHAFNNRK